MSFADTYLNHVMDLLARVKETQMQAVEHAAQVCSRKLKAGGILYTFGTGHSHLLAEEIFYRAGGLVRVYPILDQALMLHDGAAKSTDMERVEGYAAVLAAHHNLQRDDVIFIFSNSGRNAVTVEMALEAKKRGLFVISVTNLAHSTSVSSRHSSGKKLMEVSDLVIDNGGCVGDASMEIGGDRVGPTSTVIGAALMQSIICRIVEICMEEKTPVEVFSSSNVDQGDEINSAYIKKYKNQIQPLW